MEQDKLVHNDGEESVGEFPSDYHHNSYIDSLKPLEPKAVKGLKIYFTSDHHWFHHNVIKYSNRPFKTTDEMNQYMIERWNEVVPKKGAMVYHLGDLSLSGRDNTLKIIEQLNGQIYFIRGNHDKSGAERCSEKFVWIKDYAYLNVQGYKIALCHYAFRTWRGMYHGSINLHGHSHGGLQKFPIRQLDVGVDVWDYKPVHISTIFEKINEQTFG